MKVVPQISMKVSGLILFILFIGYCQAQITFSEIMFDVATNEYHDEFIEIFNLSYHDFIPVSGWRFSDSSGTDQIVSISGEAVIPPRCFAVILDKSYFENSLTYQDVLPDTVLILTISDNAFGNSGLSNTEGEYLTISDSNGKVLTAYRYTPGNPPGYSDEKVNLDEENSPDNWKNSACEGGTPGWQNSVSPPRIDYGFDSRSLILPALIIEGQSQMISLKIFNYGSENSKLPLELEVFADLDRNGIYQDTDRQIVSQRLDATEQVFDFVWPDPPPGRYDLTAILRQEEDERSQNNRITVEVDVYTETAALRINEINFLSDDQEPEWIELINTGTTPVFLNGWSLMDARDTILIDTAAVIEGNAYLVLSEADLPEKYNLSADRLLLIKNLPTLNDQGDFLQISSPAGMTVEEVSYEIDWLEGESWRRVSLERINPALNSTRRENWGPCLDAAGGTPGRRNSLFVTKDPGTMEITAAPNPFSPDGDGTDDVTMISGRLASSSARIKVQIFDLMGRLIRTLEENRFSANNFSLIWDGKDENRAPVRIGIYIIYLQMLNDRQGILREMKTTVVLARKL